MKPKYSLRHLLSVIGGSLLTLSSSHAQTTYTWDSSNVTGATPPATLDWFTGGANPLGLWTGPVVPLSASNNTIRFFADITTSLPNTAPATQTANLNNGGSAFQLGTLQLNGFGSATSGASLTMTLQGDALNFSGATGTITFDGRKNTIPATDPVIPYNVNNNIQLGTASSVSALTINGNGDGSAPSTTTYNIGGAISELQTGGGSIVKSGTNTVNITGALSITGGVTVSTGQLNLTNNTNTASSFTVNGGTLNVTGSTISASTMTANGGTLILTGNHNPASGSMTVNSGGILQIGNNTATQFGPAGVYSGNISTGTGGTLRLWSSSAQTLSGIISGSGGIQKAYGGALTLSGANTYTGRTLFQPQTTTGFTVNVSSFNSVVGGTASSSLGAPTTVANGTVDIGSGSAQAGVNLTYTGTGETTDRVMNIVFNGTSSQTITSNNASGLLRFTSAFTASPASTGQLILRGTGSAQIDLGIPQLSSGGLNKNDAGTWTLGGTGLFTGPTSITAGTLSLSSATALQNSPFSTASVAGGAAAGLRIDTTTLTLGGLTGTNALRGRFTTALGGPSSATAQGGYDGLTNLTLNTAAGSISTYTGVIAEGATGMSLTKTGAGIQTITAANGYTGTTFVNGGFLQLNGSTLTGGLSVNSAQFASNSTFAGPATVTSGVISPGASSGSIGTLTLSNASASALTLDGSTGIFDLPSTVTTTDRIAVTGGLVVTGTNTIHLRTPTAGTPAGVYTLITAGSTSGAGSFVLANGSATRGNATVSTSGNDVILTVTGAGLAGTTTYTGAATSSGTDGWNVGANWNGGVPTGTINVVLPDKTSAFNIGATANTIPTFSGDLWIGNNVTLQMSFTTQHNATIDNVLGTPGQTIIYMGANSVINNRNSYSGSPNKTIPQIVLLGDATMRFQESTNGAVTPNFDYSISGPYTLTFNSGVSGSGATHNLNAANSFSGLALTTGASNILNANASGSIGTAKLIISGGGTVSLNHATALADGSNPIQINNGTVTYGSASSAPLTLSTRPIELNGTGQATINNNNTASSSANILTLAGGISSTASGAKTLTLSGTNLGLNLVSGLISNGTGGGTIGVAKTGAGIWQLSGNNSYTGTTGVSLGTLIMSGNNTLTGTITVSGASGATLTLSGDNSGMSSNVTLATSFPTTAGSSPLLNINSATALGTGTLTFGGGAASDTVRIDNTSAGAVTVNTANAITMNRNFTFVGTQELSLGTGTSTLGGMTSGTNRSISVTTKTLTLNGTIVEATPGNNNGITKLGAGTLVLSGTGNSYAGSTVVSAGTLVGIGANAFGSTSGISIAGAGTLSLRGDSSTNFVKTSNSSAYGITTSASGSTINVDQATIAGTAAKTMTIGSLGSTSTAVGYQVNFTGANNTSLNVGAVTGSISTALATVTLNNTISSTGQLALASYNSANTTGGETLILTGTGIGTISGAITPSATTLSLQKSNGTGTWVLSGSSSYTGLTTVIGGTLVAGANAPSAANGAFGNASSEISLGAAGGNTDASLLIGGAFTVGRTVRLATSDTTDAGTRVLTLGGNTAHNSEFSGNIFLGTASQAGRGVTLTAASGGQVTFSGVIQNPGSMDATTYTVTKSGLGTVVLSNSNTYTGATTVSAGILALGANDVLPTTEVSIGAATLNAATFSDTVGTLDVTAAAVINLGTGGALAFADSAAVDWTGGTLNITGTLGATSIRFGTSSSGLTPAQLAVISVNGSGAGTYTLDADGYLVGGGSDMTPPTLTSIADDKTGGPVNIGTVVTYTVTFSEDIDASTVDATDFGNAGTATVSIGTVTETSPGVFTVAVTTNSPGSLKLRIPTGAVIKDVAGNDLVVPVEDDTTLTVRTPFEAWANAAGATGGSTGDPDGDGFVNLMEYGFDTNPTSSSAASIAYANGVVTAHGQPILVEENGFYYAVFGRRVDHVAAGLTYTVEFSAGLDQWTASATGLSTVATDGTIDAVRAPFPITVMTPSGPKKPTFFRVVVSQP